MDYASLTARLAVHKDIVIAVVSFVVMLALAKIVFFFIKRHIHKLTEKTKTEIDNILVAALGKPVYIGVVIVSLYFILKRVEEIEGYMPHISMALAIFGIAIAVFAAMRVLKGILRWYEQQAPEKRRLDHATVILLRRGIYALTYIIAGVIMLHILGVNITPILASLGVGGLAVALALQSTLSNYFAGIYITTDKTVKPGDFVELDNGMKGTIEFIGWRSTRIRTLQNNLVVVPNAKLADSILTNYTSQDSALNIIINCGAAYGSDLDKVEKVTLEVAKEVLEKTPGGIKDFEPIVMFKEFGDSNINFTVTLKAKDYAEGFGVKHAFIKALAKRFRKEKIEIAFPCRNVYMRK